MNSSVKYEKFAVSKDEDKEKKTGGRKKLLGCLLVFAILAAISVAISVGVGISIGHESEQKKTSGLNSITLTKTKIEGEYYGSAGEIYFLSTMNGSDTNLTITTGSGDIIISIRHPQDSSMTMMSLNDTYYLLVEDQSSSDDSLKYQGFTIPENNSELMKSVIENHPRMSEIISMVNSIIVEDISFEYIVMCPEADLIIEAAEALGGGLNMTGPDYPSTMPFYLLALTLAESRTNMERIQNTERRQKRKYEYDDCTYDYMYGLLYYIDCPNCPNGHCDISTRCPDRTKECIGMCGPGCKCWPWVCGGNDNHCCIFNGCLNHDNCCKHFGAYKCWKAIFMVWHFVERWILGKSDCFDYSCDD